MSMFGSALRRRRRHTLLALAVPLAIVYALLVRPWHLGWGATGSDRTMAMTVDRTIPPGATVSTRAITIDAPDSIVWGWIIQLGQGRGGFYSYEWLENLFAAGMENTERIDPRLAMQVGDTFSYKQDGPFDRVSSIDPGRHMTVGNGWEWYLEPLDAGTTRLVVRYAYDWSSGPAHALFYFAIFEPAHFVMESGMMIGIKVRAERSARQMNVEQPESQGRRK